MRSLGKELSDIMRDIERAAGPTVFNEMLPHVLAELATLAGSSIVWCSDGLCAVGNPQNRAAAPKQATQPIPLPKREAPMTRRTIEDKVRTMAKQMADANPKMTLIEAEAQAWQRHPELYSEWHALPAEVPQSSQAAPQTFAEDDAANRLWREFEDKAVALMGRNTLMSREQALAEVLTSAEGKTLYSRYDELKRQAQRARR